MRSTRGTASLSLICSVGERDRWLKAVMPLTRLWRFTEAGPGWLVGGATAVVVVEDGSLPVVEDATVVVVVGGDSD